MRGINSGAGRHQPRRRCREHCIPGAIEPRSTLGVPEITAAADAFQLLEQCAKLGEVSVARWDVLAVGGRAQVSQHLQRPQEH
jgi:hypothetical protein